MIDCSVKRKPRLLNFRVSRVIDRRNNERLPTINTKIYQLFKNESCH